VILGGFSFPGADSSIRRKGPSKFPWYQQVDGPFRLPFLILILILIIILLLLVGALS